MLCSPPLVLLSSAAAAAEEEEEGAKYKASLPSVATLPGPAWRGGMPCLLCRWPKRRRGGGEKRDSQQVMWQNVASLPPLASMALGAAREGGGKGGGGENYSPLHCAQGRGKRRGYKGAERRAAAYGEL